MIESNISVRMTHDMLNNGSYNNCFYKFTASNESHVIRISFSHSRSDFDEVDYVTETSRRCKETDTVLLVGTHLKDVDDGITILRDTRSTFLFCGDDLILPPFVSVAYTGWVDFRGVNDMNVTFTVEALPKGISQYHIYLSLYLSCTHDSDLDMGPVHI